MKRSHKRPHWTGAEDAQLCTHYPHVGAQGCVALIPGRDVNGIYARARKLGLRSPRVRNPRRNYPADDRIDDAIRHAARHGNRRGDWLKLSRRFKRPRCYFARRARQLGVTTARVFERQWHEAELDLLHDTAALRVAEAAATFKRNGFDRSAVAIGKKRDQVRVDTTRYGRYTARGLAELLGHNVLRITRAIAAGELQSRQPTAGTNDYHVISDAHVRAFLIAHPLRLDLRRMPPANVPWLIDLLTAKTGE